MDVRVGFGFVTWPESSKHLGGDMLMEAVGMWDCSGLLVLPARTEDRLKFLSVKKDISPGRSIAGRDFHTFLSVWTAYHECYKTPDVLWPQFT